LHGGRWPALAAGIQHYLVKPVSRQRLLDAVQAAAPQGGRVLIVDDEPKIMRLLARIVRSAPQTYEVLRATNGQEALRILQASQPDLLLLDLYMPEHDGFHLLDCLQSTGDLAQLPVIVISATKLPDDGILRLGGPLAVSRSEGLTLTETFRLLQPLLDALP
jgi:CheY-like chemotaxis protein